MKRKITVAALLSLFAWNAVFGGVGGLLLCLHQSMTLHPELISGKVFDCASVSVDQSAELKCISESESCVDVELEAVDLPQVRLDEAQSAPVFNPLHALLSTTFEVVEQNFTLKEIAHIVQAQAPPELLDTSVLVAQTVNLRL
ncbi:hypothetical protein QEH59_12545 [Coraliomargarita sp. SDUM461004]|uniref:Secreted protein n=1 Tax=Thalassobacterium sedimentorum TaxID=3041258 RepID=A0ABU1AKB8_9BACT|nr:hypothetical protein [Coraliomargarita sp. SDUM461004]MDQ8195260.1 hypothetical protein [Coraliomargarita sp. SDUM461004]